MNDLKTFTFLRLMKYHYQMPDYLIIQNVDRLAQIEIPRDEFQGLMLLAEKVKTKYYVHELSQMGYSPQFIADFLTITPQTVSYHMHNPPKDTFYSPQLARLRREKSETEKQIEQLTTK